MTWFGLDRRVGRLLGRPRLRTVVPLASIALFVVALGVLYFELRAYRYAEIVRAVEGYPLGTLVLAAAFAAVSYL